MTPGKPFDSIDSTGIDSHQPEAQVNEKQKRLLIAIAAVVLGMLLFPPFHIRMTGGVVVWTGYSWIFGPYRGATVNIALLITQWIGVLIVGAIVWFLLKDR